MVTILKKVWGYIKKVLVYTLEFIKKFWVAIPILIILAIIIVPPFYFKKELTPFEIRYYVAIFLFSVVATSFGVLRVYNAVVINSRYMLFLRNSIGTLMSEIRRLRDVVERNSKEIKTAAEKTIKENQKNKK